MKSKLLLALALSAFVALASTTARAQADPRVPILSFEQFEPLTRLDDDTTYVINFWATWCAPCVAELPAFERLDSAMAGQPVRVVLVSLDFKSQYASRLLPFVNSKGLRARVLMLDAANPNSWIDKVSPQWSGALPATLIYNRHGRAFHERGFTYPELLEAFEQVHQP